MASSAHIPDVLVIGAGASGAAFVWSMAEAGVSVVCLEQGGWLAPDAYSLSEPDALIHWQTDFHPDPSVRQLPEDYPVDSSESPIAPYMYNAVGGSTVHYGSHYPRFHPSDFEVRTQDGVAEDWPISYQELEPYFDLNDRIMGVSGLNGDPAYPPKPERPCPPLSIRTGGELLTKGFDKLGWHWWAGDTAISSVLHDGREPDTGGYMRSLASTDLTFWPGPSNWVPNSRPTPGSGRSWSTGRGGLQGYCTTVPTGTFTSSGPRRWCWLATASAPLGCC